MNRRDRLDAVMDKVHLSAAVYFPHDHLGKELIIQMGDFGVDGETFFGRSLDPGEIPGS